MAAMILHFELSMLLAELPSHCIAFQYSWRLTRGNVLCGIARTFSSVSSAAPTMLTRYTS